MGYFGYVTDLWQLLVQLTGAGQIKICIYMIFLIIFQPYQEESNY